LWALHSFPTRRSSDLGGNRDHIGQTRGHDRLSGKGSFSVRILAPRHDGAVRFQSQTVVAARGQCHHICQAEREISLAATVVAPRSEEHTSELQSLAYL